MRIISGIYRGRRIKTVPGLDVRPTSDRLRETLFNILAPDIRGARFLDICSGSGAVGIEALSRGAASVTAIENARRALTVMQENLQTLGITDAFRIISRDALAALSQLDAETHSGAGKFDVAYFDPPYATDLYARVLEQLASGTLLSEDARVIAEYHAKRPPARQYGNLRLYREVKQGESCLAFYTLET